MTRRLDIQTKIILVLVAVIVPTFLIVTVLENKLTQPMLEGEMKRIGIITAESLATKVASNRWLSRSQHFPRIDQEIQELAYLQPNIIRMDVFAKDPLTGMSTLIASNVVDESAPIPYAMEIADFVSSEFKKEEGGPGYWEIRVPIKQASTSSKAPAKVIGMVQALVSTQTVTRLLETVRKITGAAAAVSVVILILALSFFLRKAVANERLLRIAEDQNLQLSRQLQEAERQLMNVEKLAVMGQLTANFAHEIGTPLNAIGGHLQLLSEEWASGATQGGRWKERLGIISGELERIEKIVKGFLQTTAKPVSQRQLVDLNSVIDKTLGLVRPRLDGMGVSVRSNLDRAMGPVRVVPLDVEQILLNLVNNSLGSLQAKASQTEDARLELRVTSHVLRREQGEWAEITVYDSGIGIRRDDLGNVKKAFFTTKRPGEGTGLGLTICAQLATKYGGVLQIDAKENAWAQVKLQLPYQNT